MTLRDIFQGIYDEHGRLTAQLVVDEASDPESLLHSHFEWDDEVAAEQHRLAQARKLIRKVRITFQPHAEANFSTIRAWRSVATSEGRTYRPAEEVAEDSFLLKLHLQDMEREWRSLKEKYERFAEFAEMVRRDLGDDGAAA